jgi:hypothetical protein
MIQPHYSRLSALTASSVFPHKRPTGKGFGGSNLLITQSEKLVFSIVSDAVLVANDTTPICTEQPSPLVVEVGKILLLVIWLWCSIGANFCFNSMSEIVRYSVRDV